ncbi:MAG: methylated-DNA--[protein]-cysteine S-methyltransferase [Candidatus Rokubacteria bacterium]|nr:methylated-DNA--[protein]-cysteine S-methyltransferase [Candidatus Rokubacteria bacterium]
MPTTCREIANELIAVGVDEAGPGAAERVGAHVAICRGCRDELGRYRAIGGLVGDLRRAPIPGSDPTLARAELESRLADLRSRLVSYRTFSSPLGPILIARSEQGVSLVEYLDPATGLASSRIAAMAGADASAAPREDGAEIESLYRELLDYLEGRRGELGWRLDLRWAGSDFQRRVLRAAAAIPYGAVTSYTNLARQMGAPRATRAVAQALRRNPVPVAIPCHRVIGSSGTLVGYAGDKVDLKHRLLAVEGVRTVPARGDYRIERPAMYVQQDAWYCLPSCGDLSQTPLTRLTLFGSRERAEAIGLAPCESCRPDLHPISR